MRSRTVFATAAIAVIVAIAIATVGATAVAQPTTDSSASIDGPHSSHADPSPAFAVAPQADGSAQIHVTYAFDLADDAQAEAFEELRTNETATTAFEERFHARLNAVAANAADATGREMAVRDVELTLRTVDGTGIVEVSLTWDGLAAVDDDQLVITEPFASGFESSRPVHVLVPDGYAVASATPTPAEQTDKQLTWPTNSDLDGFELVLESDGKSTDGGLGSGFGVLAGILSVLALMVLARWQTR